MAIGPKPVKTTAPDLEVILGSLMCLYIKAKRYHFNVTGPTFHGDHVTFDGIADGALEWYDVIGERMRALDIPVCACPARHAEVAVFDTMGVPTDAPAKAMLAEMLHSLERLSTACNSGKFEGGPTTENILQEVDAFVGKQMYFVRSSM